MINLREKHSSEYELVARKEVETFEFDAQQADLLHRFSRDIVAVGGPQAAGAKMKASLAATELTALFSMGQRELVQRYSSGLMSLLIFEGLKTITDAAMPEELPPMALLERDGDIQCLAARNQILLKIVDHQAFAYDIDNEGKLVRLVANFKGGGAEKIQAEPEKAELSSHSGLSLGPHTEAPYWCSVNAENDHSPSPSALILSALWNPAMEPTSVIPLPPLLEKLGVTNSLALTSRNFNFTRSDSFVSGKGEDGHAVSILDFNDKIGFSARFNSYRFSVAENASAFVRNAYHDFCRTVGEAAPYQHALTQTSAMVINNNRALHCRDVVKDNRRLLVRLFGLSKISKAIVISEDPLLLRG